MNQELASWGPMGYPTKMSLKTFRGRRFVDLRKHFGDQPTKKGIMLSGAQYAELLQSVLAHGSQIASWFAEEAGEVAERVESFQARLQEARRREAARLPNTEVIASSSAGNSLFHMEFRGANAVVKVNGAHPFVRALESAVTARDHESARHLLLAVLQSSFHAVALAASGDDTADLDAAEEHAHFLATLLTQVRVARP